MTMNKKQQKANLAVEVCIECEREQLKATHERDKEIERLKAENKRLQEQLSSANAGNVNCSGCSVVETNAIKEFAEHLKKYAIKTNSPAWGLIEFVEVSDIDRLLDYYMSMRDENRRKKHN